MPDYKDQLGRTVTLAKVPERVVSIVPSQTEYLFDLGLEEEVVGITRFCIKPESWFRNKTRVGGTKALDIQKIADLNPDLIIANKEENDQAQIEALWDRFPVWVSDIYTLDDARAMMQSIGSIFQRDEQAKKIIDATRNLIPSNALRPALYLIWNDPYMAAGTDTFIHTMMEVAGFANMAEKDSRYPNFTLEELQEIQPEVLLLSSEPYPFKEEHQRSLEQQLPNTKIVLVDGEMFSWYGSRLAKALPYFDQLRASFSY